MRVIVIGAGVLGASTAYHLACEGFEVAVVDQAHDGRATAAGAGVICPWVSGMDDPAFYQLYAAGARYYADLVPALAELGETNLGFRRVGALVVSTDATELSFIEHLLHRRRAEAPEVGGVSRVSSCDARTLFPPLRADFAGVHVTGGARVDGRRLAAALLRAARRYGATIMKGHADLLVSGSRIAGVRVETEILATDQVVVTAGAWAPALLQPLSLDLPVEPQRGQIMHLRLSGQDTHAWPVILPPGSHYLLTFDDSRIVVGATRETGVGFDYRVTAAGQAEVLTEALQVAPGLAAATVLETRVGFRPMSRDMLPLLGRVQTIEGLVIGNGLGAAGLTIGPFAGRLLADVALGRSPSLDLTPFDPLRPHIPGQRSLPPLR
jgi:D-amino-acid dehydrogenase